VQIYTRRHNMHMGNTYLEQNNIAQTIMSADKSAIQMMISFSATQQAMNYFSSNATLISLHCKITGII
jgi:hypothetical protein